MVVTVRHMRHGVVRELEREPAVWSDADTPDLASADNVT